MPSLSCNGKSFDKLASENFHEIGPSPFVQIEQPITKETCPDKDSHCNFWHEPKVDFTIAAPHSSFTLAYSLEKGF